MSIAAGPGVGYRVFRISGVRTWVTLLALAAPDAAARAQPAAASQPAPLSTEQRGAAIAALRAKLDARERTVQEVLVDAASDPLREDRRFRELVREFAREATLRLVPPGERGKPMHVAGTIRTPDGAPVEGALVYVFQTDARGVYSRGGGNATMGDSLNPRIFGYLRTGRDGRYGFTTIRPGPYPGGGPPAHVHYEISTPGRATFVSELVLGDCPRLTDEGRGEFERAGFVIARPNRDAEGVQQVVCDMVIRSEQADRGR